MESRIIYYSAGALDTLRRAISHNTLIRIYVNSLAKENVAGAFGNLNSHWFLPVFSFFEILCSEKGPFGTDAECSAMNGVSSRCTVIHASSSICRTSESPPGRSRWHPFWQKKSICSAGCNPRSHPIGPYGRRSFAGKCAPGSACSYRHSRTVRRR